MAGVKKIHGLRFEDHTRTKPKKIATVVKHGKKAKK
jgi:hypothetical protein